MLNNLIFKSVPDFIKKYFWSMLLVFMIMIPNLFIVLNGQDFENTGIFKKMLFLLLSLTLILLPFYFAGFRKSFALLFPVVSFVIPELLHISISRNLSTSGIMMSLFNTNINETAEFISAIKIWLAGWLILLALYLYILIVKIPPKMALPKSVARTFMVILIGLSSIIWCRDLFIIYKIDKNKDLASIIYGGTAGFIHHYSRIFPTNLLYNLWAVGTQKINQYVSAGKLSSFRFGAYRKANVSAKEIYVIVIGETSRFANWQINGYERPTSPCLNNQQGLISLKNVYSAADATGNSLATLLTRATPLDIEKAFKEKNLVSAAREAGFKTYWLVNNDIYEAFLNYSLPDADQLIDLNSSNSSYNTDEIILPELKKILQKPDQKQFIVINTIGSHWRYNYRYPQEFERFKPAMQGVFELVSVNVKNRNQLVNSYDNSILYTDYIINEIIEIVKSENAVAAVSFISDHGENLCDDENGLFFHANAILTEYSVHVPFFLWFSDLYKDFNQQKVEVVKSRVDSKISATSFFYTMLDLSGIGLPGSDSTASFANSGYREPEFRYVLTSSGEVKELK